MLTVDAEPGYDAFYREAHFLVAHHWEEVGSHNDFLELNPDHGRYRALEAVGVLQILVARDAGKMVGYFLYLVMRHPRDSEATVVSDDSIYVQPRYRKHLLGPRLIRTALARCTDAGINIAFIRTRVWREQNDALLKRMGFAPHEMVWAKVLNREKRVRREALAS